MFRVQSVFDANKFYNINQINNDMNHRHITLFEIILGIVTKIVGFRRLDILFTFNCRPFFISKNYNRIGDRDIFLCFPFICEKYLFWWLYSKTVFLSHILLTDFSCFT